MLNLQNFGLKSLQDVLGSLNASLVTGPVYPLDYYKVPDSNQPSAEVKRPPIPLSNRESNVSAWHKRFETTPRDSPEGTRNVISAIESKEWLESFVKENPSAKEVLLAKGISDEQSYIKK